jgi:AcrR family transcriptional regulator
MPEPVATRHTRRKARTRDEIHRAAMRLFAARGVDAVTIEQICDEADVARATFFLHFPSKDAVLTEYARQALDELTATLRAHTGNAVEALGAALATLADRATRQAALVQVVVREVMARPQAALTNAEQSRGLVDLLAVIIKRGQKRGEIRRGIPPQLAAGVVAVAYLAVVAEWARDPGALDLKRGVAQALDVVLNGLVAAKRPEEDRRWPNAPPSSSAPASRASAPRARSPTASIA